MRDDALLRSLGRELFQTEMSAAAHCRREAKRLGETPVASALTKVAKHAEEVLKELPDFAPRHGMPLSIAGMTVGQIFSTTREFIADRLIRRERSYRGTLIGIRHGLDLVRLLQHCARQRADSELFHWCEQWLEIRSELALGVEAELDWFATHPELAMQFAGSKLPRAKDAEGAAGPQSVAHRSVLVS